MISTNKNSFPDILNVFGFCLIFRGFVNYCIRGSSSWDGGGQQKIGKVSDTKKKQVVKHFIANITASTNCGIMFLNIKLQIFHRLQYILSKDLENLEKSVRKGVCL